MGFFKAVANWYKKTMSNNADRAKQGMAAKNGTGKTIQKTIVKSSAPKNSRGVTTTTVRNGGKIVNSTRSLNSNNNITTAQRQRATANAPKQSFSNVNKLFKSIDNFISERSKTYDSLNDPKEVARRNAQQRSRRNDREDRERLITQRLRNDHIVDPRNRVYTTAELGQFAGLRDTARSQWDQNHYNNIVSSRYSQEQHDSIIDTCEGWFNISRNDGKATFVNDWLNNTDDYATAQQRYDQYNHYMRHSLVTRSYPDPDRNYIGTVTFDAISKDADLPPWIPRTRDNLAAWDYYKSYMTTVIDAQVKAADEAKDQYDMALRNPYKSAWSEDDNKKGTVNSLIDVVYSGLGSKSGLFSKDTVNTFKNYVDEYYINPSKTGHFGAYIGNRIWNFFDIMDVAARGTRALAAGEQAIGGLSTDKDEYDSDGNLIRSKTEGTFTGQDVFWIDPDNEDMKAAQTLFMQNGGQFYLSYLHPEKGGLSDRGTRSKEEYLSQIKAAFNDAHKHGRLKNISWKDVERGIQEGYYGAVYDDNGSIIDYVTPERNTVKGIIEASKKNLKEAYTTPGANFHADTGSIGSDIIIEFLYDPGLVLGGITKSVAGSGARKLGTEAITEGFKSIGYADGLNSVVKNSSKFRKEYNKAIKAFVQNTDNTNLLFKNREQVEALTNKFADDIGKQLPDIFVHEAGYSTKDAFVRNVTNTLIGNSTDINAKVISNTLRSQKSVERRLFETAARIDKGIDTIDSALLKASFIEPTLAIKLLPRAKRGLMNHTFVGTLINKQRLKTSRLAQYFDNEVRHGNIANINRYVDAVSSESADYVRRVADVNMQINNASGRVEEVLRNFRRGKITLDNARSSVDNIVLSLTGGKYKSIKELDSLFYEAETLWSRRFDDAYGRLKDTILRFERASEANDAITFKNFLDEINNAVDANGLRKVLQDYVGKLDLVSLRSDISGAIISDELRKSLDDFIDEANEYKLLGLIDLDKDAVVNAGKSLEHNLDNLRVRNQAVFKTIDSIKTKYPELQSLLVFDDLGKHYYLRELKDVFIKAGTDSDYVLSNDSLIRILDRTNGRALGHLIKRDLDDIDTIWKALRELRSEAALADSFTTMDGISSVTTFHLDKQAVYNNFIDDPDVSRIFDEVYDQCFGDLIDRLASKSINDVGIAKHKKLYSRLLDMRDIRQCMREYNNFVAEINNIDGITIPKANTIINSLFGNFGSNSLSQVTRNSEQLRNYLKTAIYNQFGESKLGMSSLTTRLKSIDNVSPDDTVSRFKDEYLSNEDLRNWYDSIVNADVANPESYVNKQILSSILLDPSLIDKYNAYDKAPIFLHISTTSLNSDTGTITGLAYKQWNKEAFKNIHNGSSLAEIKEAFEQLDSGSILRTMTDEEINSIDKSVIRAIYSGNPGLNSLSIDELVARYKSTFGLAEGKVVNSEEDILTKYCELVHSNSYTTVRNGLGSKQVFDDINVPRFVVHDSEGFNIPYINNRIKAFVSDNGLFEQYNSVFAHKVSNNLSNTFIDLRRVIGDNSFTDEELRAVEKAINNMDSAVKRSSSHDFSFLDVKTYLEDLTVVNSELRNVTSDSDPDLISIANNFKGFDYTAVSQPVYSKLNEVDRLNEYAKSSSVVSHKVSDSHFYGFNISDDAIYEKLNQEQLSAIENISRIFNFNTSFVDSAVSNSPTNVANTNFLDKTLNFNNSHSDYLSKAVYGIINHELGHNFDSYIAPEIFGVLSRRFDDYTSLFKFLSDSDVDFTKYIEYKTVNQNYSNDIAELVEELRAQTFAYYFNNTDFMKNVRSRINSLDITPSEKELFNSYFDSLGVLYKTSKYRETVVTASEREVIEKLFKSKKVEDAAVEGIVNMLQDSKRFRDSSILSAAIDTNATQRSMRSVGDIVLHPNDRFNIDLSRNYFDIDILNPESSGVSAFTMETLKRMSDTTKFIDNAKHYRISSIAEETLTPYKSKFDEMIVAIKNIMATSDNTLASRLDYLKYLRVPESAVDSYLLAQKLYDDFLKFWLNDMSSTSYDALVKRIAKSGADPSLLVERYELRAFTEFCDGVSFTDIAKLFSTNFNDINTVDYDSFRILKSGYLKSSIFKDIPADELTYKQTVFKKFGAISDKLKLSEDLRNSLSDIQSNIHQLNYVENSSSIKAISDTDNRRIAMAYTNLSELFNRVRSVWAEKDITDALYELSANRVKLFHQHRYSRLLSEDGLLDSDKLISELLWNDVNHIAFNKAHFSDEQLRIIEDGVSEIGFIGTKFDSSSDTFYVYLKRDACDVFSDKSSNNEVRYIHNLIDNSIGTGYTRPNHEAIGLADLYDNELDDDILFLLNRCYSEQTVISKGASNGTLGRVVDAYAYDKYMTNINSIIPDMLPSSNMVDMDMRMHTLYDPGFILDGDHDVLLDLIPTLNRESSRVKEDVITIDYVFGHHADSKFADVIEELTDSEVVEIFKNTDNFVPCCLIKSDTVTGYKVVRLDLSSESAVATARQMGNTVILPFDFYMQLEDKINIPAHMSTAHMYFNKALIALKASQMCRPSTVVRNIWDATKKAAFDQHGGVSDMADMFMYESKAIKDIQSASKILKSEGKWVIQGDWDRICKRYNIDLSWEDYELVRGLMDGSNTYNKSGIGKFKKGIRRISGEGTSLDNLDEADIKRAYRKFIKGSDNLDEADFLDIYLKRRVPTEIEQIKYDDTLRKIGVGINSATVKDLDWAISTTFKPMNWSETVVRYAQMQKLLDSGLSANQAAVRIDKTQFSIASRMSVAHKLEVVFPFITFKYNNFMYWMKLIEQNPRVFRYFENIYGNIYGANAEGMLDQNAQFDYNSDYMVQTGGIPLGSNGLYLKLGNSFMDALNVFYGGSTQLVNSLNPLLRLAVRHSMYNLGFDSKLFFNEIDLDFSNESWQKQVAQFTPVFNQIYSMYNNLTTNSFLWQNAPGPTSKLLLQLLPGLFGITVKYSDNSEFQFKLYQEELVKQGLWYDANTGSIRPLSEKNEYGANAEVLDPNFVDNFDAFKDIQAYMLVHFNKIWDANQQKFVKAWEYTDGGFNQKFDFENDPDAWDKLCKLYKEKRGMVYDYNVGNFVKADELSSGGLNDPKFSMDQSNLSREARQEIFEERAQLFKELHNKVWDSNQNAFVTPDKYIAGGLNDVKMPSEWNKLQALRKAMYGEEYGWYENEEGKMVKGFHRTSDPKVVTLGSLYELPEYDTYYSYLGIPRLENIKLKDTNKIEIKAVNGYLMIGDKYVLTGNASYNAKVFDKLAIDYAVSSGGYGRSYSSWKNYSYGKSTRVGKGRFRTGYSNHLYTGIGWNDKDAYYRLNYQFNYQYHSPQPGSKLRRLYSPKVNYPYGGGYNKFSFYMR